VIAMKIANAKTILLSMPFEADGIPPWSFGGKPANAFDILLVRLETNDGLVGWGEAFSRGRDIALKQTIDTRLLPLILGRDATQISKIKHSLEFQLHNFGRISGVEYGIAAIDIALWDLLGKACGQPPYRFARLYLAAPSIAYELIAAIKNFFTSLSIPPRPFRRFGRRRKEAPNVRIQAAFFRASGNRACRDRHVARCG
jgi:hypothetical protein